jgi:hypothetical protein
LADIDSKYSTTCAVMKFLGNSAYEKTLANKAKHAEVSYCTGEDTTNFINDLLIKNMTDVREDLFEVEKFKKKLNWDLPLHIGFFVYH